jgi:hypothetical protein
MFSKKPAAAAVSPERAALAAAILKRDERRAEIRAVETAVATAESTWREARDRLHAAEAGVPAAQAAAAEYATMQAMGKAGEAPVSVKAARAMAQEAVDEVEAAEGALAALRQRAEAVNQYSFIPERDVAEAAAKVVRAAPETAALVARVTELQRQLADAGGALLALSEARCLDLANIKTPTASVFPPAKVALTRCQTPPGHWHDLLKVAPGAARWRAALAALAVDAGAPLPEVVR